MFGRKKKVVVEVYKSEKAMRKGVEKMGDKGYVVQTSVAKQDGRSKKSWLFAGLFNFLRKQKTAYTVTFCLAE
jgi:hypothetical protein